MTQAQSGGKRTGRRGWLVAASASLLIFLSACSSATRTSTSVTPTTSGPSSSRQPEIGEVLMPNPGSLWATLDNGQVFYSSDGGSTWRDVTPQSSWSTEAAWGRTGGLSEGPPPSSVLSVVHSLPNGIAQVALSTDEGRTWRISVLPSVEAGNMPELPGNASFVDGNDGWVILGPQGDEPNVTADVYHTTDGGAVWRYQSTVRYAAGPVEFISTKVGFVGGSAASDELYETTDGGDTWSEAALPPLPHLIIDPPGIPDFTDSEHGFLPVISSGVTKGTGGWYMDETSDGGATWTDVALPPVGTPPAWSVVYSQDWFWAGPDAVMHTTDGGRTWTTVKPNRPLTDISYLHFASDEVGVALIATSTCPSPGLSGIGNCVPESGLVRTDDGGKTWQSLPTP
jgi:photosystem II stability/assembly factor-like uncharacterized protein